MHLRRRRCTEAGCTEEHLGIGITKARHVVADRVEHIGPDETRIDDLGHALANCGQRSHRIAFLATGKIAGYFRMQQRLAQGTLTLGHESGNALSRLCGNALSRALQRLRAPDLPALEAEQQRRGGQEDCARRHHEGTLRRSGATHTTRSASHFGGFGPGEQIP